MHVLTYDLCGCYKNPLKGYIFPLVFSCLATIFLFLYLECDHNYAVIWSCSGWPTLFSDWSPSILIFCSVICLLLFWLVTCPVLSLCATLLHSSLCQFNHFSHFKMTIPQFYRSSCLSLPVSTPSLAPLFDPAMLVRHVSFTYFTNSLQPLNAHVSTEACLPCVLHLRVPWSPWTTSRLCLKLTLNRPLVVW